MAGFNIATLKTNDSLETSGVWVEYHEGSRLLIGRMNNENADKARRRLATESRLRLEAGGDRADAVAKEIEETVRAEHILLGWEGLVDGSGEEIAYSVETARELLKIKDFARDVDGFSTDRTRFQEEAVKADSEALKKQ